MLFEPPLMAPAVQMHLLNWLKPFGMPSFLAVRVCDHVSAWQLRLLAVMIALN
jgi:hypothetical protein